MTVSNFRFKKAEIGCFHQEGAKAATEGFGSLRC